MGTLEVDGLVPEEDTHVLGADTLDILDILDILLAVVEDRDQIGVDN